jgi:hypothetical protein
VKPAPAKSKGWRFVLGATLPATKRSLGSF